MNIKNLKIGQVVKNYKELCSLLGVEERKKGKARQDHFEYFKRYFNYEREGHKFIIKEIHQTPIEKIDKMTLGVNTAPYIEDTELLLIDFLLYSKGEIKIATTGLLKVLKMVNTDYSKYFGTLRPILAKNLNIDIAYINDYYNNVGSMLKDNIKTVLNRLHKKKLIVYKNIHMVEEKVAATSLRTNDGKIKIISEKFIDDNGIEQIKYTTPKLEVNTIYREADTKEIRKILKIEREVYLELGLREDSKYNEVIKKGIKKQYDDMLRDRLSDEMNIVKHYEAYHIIYNNEDLELEREFIIDEISKELKQNKVNHLVQDRIIDNSFNRYLKFQNSEEFIEAIMFDEVEKIPEYKLIKKDSHYIKNYIDLNNALIDLNNNSSKQLYKK